jgi:hypothetical protein
MLERYSPLITWIMLVAILLTLNYLSNYLKKTKPKEHLTFSCWDCSTTYVIDKRLGRRSISAVVSEQIDALKTAKTGNNNKRKLDKR